MSVSIKTVLDENIHRFTLPQVSFEELERALCTIYGKSVLAIRYQDEDGDLISVSSTLELQEALRFANGKTLKLLLSRLDGGKKEEVGESENSVREEQAKAQAEKEAQMLVELEMKAQAEREAVARAQAEAEAAAKAQAEREAQKIADAKLLAEYQAELESAQQELKLAAEAAKQAKQAAAQAFWEAEEMKERAMKEAREKEEALLLEKEQRRQQEEAAVKLEEQQREREQQELDALIERQRVMQEELEREALLASTAVPVATPSPKQPPQDAAKAFWEAEEAREQAEKEARKLEEARWREKESSAKPEEGEKAVHTTIQCDICNVFPIVGTRYQCTLCPDFDLCAKCELTPHAHPLTHPLVKHKQPASTATIHRGVTCDNCGQSPIVGARFKCKVCPNFDLCEDCESKDVHPGDHPLFKFRKERGRPGFRMGGRQCGRPLMRGACGPRVSRLQERLAIQVDGFFGPVTEEAVKQFQASNGLVVDGVVGFQTQEKLGFSNFSAPGGLFDLLFSLSNQ